MSCRREMELVLPRRVWSSSRTCAKLGSVKQPVGLDDE